MEISNLVKEQFEFVKKTRRHLHMYPETSLEEFETQKFLLNEIDKLNPDKVDKFANTGIRVVFYGKNPKQTIAFRADMDALNLTEETTHDFVSKNVGKMHACGHDGHMAILLTLGKMISENRDDIEDNIVLLFQPAEEGTGGAKLMIDEGALLDPKVDKIFGLHLDPATPEGKIGTNYGYLMASTTEFNIDIKGLSAHGATPHLGIDTVVASADFISKIQTIVSRSIDPFEKCLITIGKIEAGESRNIIAENSHMEGTFRTYSDDVLNAINKRIEEVLDGVKRAYNVEGSYTIVAQYPSVNNEKTTTDEVISAVGMEDVIMLKPRMIAEDYSFYQRSVPGTFFFLGIQKGEYIHPLHSNHFDFDEYSLLYGLEIYRRLLGIGEK